MEKILPALAVDLKERGKIDWWQFLFCKKRGSGIGKTKQGKGAKIMVMADIHGLFIYHWKYPELPQ